MKAILTKNGPRIIFDEIHNERYIVDNRGRELDFKEPFNNIQSAKEQGEDALNDFIATVESHSGYMATRLDGHHKQNAAYTYQGFINAISAIKDAWLKQMDADLEELLNG